MSTKNETTIGGIDPNAFDGQMLLMDAYMGNIPGVNITPGAKYNGLPQVAEVIPYLPDGFDSVNRLTGLDLVAEAQNINSFIKDLTPLEYAKMYPEIRLLMVNSLTKEQTQIPFVAPPNIQGLSGQSYFYGTKEVGLKSLSLNLDGSDLPFFGKSYVVTTQIVFDSINTFTSNAPGMPMTYAEIFRSSGRVGDEQFYTRLSIGYGSNDTELVEKYSLNSPQMKFQIMLHLIKTSITIEENLKVTVEVTYQSREEALFKSNSLFDFLGLDLVDQEKQTRNDLETARSQQAALDEARQRYVENVQKSIKGSEEYKQFKKDSEFFFQQVETNSDKNVQSSLEKGKKLYNGEFRAILGNETLVDFNNLSETYQKLKKEAQDLQQSLSKQNLEKQFNESKEGKDAQKAINDKKQAAVDKLANLRHHQLTEAIENTFPFSGTEKANQDLLKAGVLKTIYLSSKQIEDYYNQNQLTDDVKKDLNATEDSQRPSFVRKTPPAAPSTVTVKEKPKDGDKGKGKSKDPPPADTSQYDKETTQLLVDLGNQKQIDYVLFGDIIRLAYARLYTVQGQSLSKLGQAGSLKKAFFGLLGTSNRLGLLNQCLLLFSDIELENFEKTTRRAKKSLTGAGMVLETKSLYDVPISTQHLKYILARELHGKQKNTFTIFELVEQLLNLIILTRKRKNQVLNNQADVGNFSLKKMTYSLLKNPGSGQPYKINTDVTVSPSKVFNGILIYVKRVKGNKPVKGATLLPEFVFGGVNKGIIRKFNVNEITDDDIQKMVMEQINGGRGDVIPSFFEIDVNTVMAPFFQLGMQIKVTAPTIDQKTAGGANVFLSGDYQVSGVTHEYTAGGAFTTSCKAILYNTDRVKQLRERGFEDTRKEREELAAAEKKRYADQLNKKEFGETEQIAAISGKFGGAMRGAKLVAARNRARAQAATEKTYACFIAGTKVLMSNGEQKSIEKIEIGDIVTSYNFNLKKLELKRVLATFNPLSNDLVEFTFENGTSTIHTYDHPYYIIGKGWCSYNPKLTIDRYSSHATELSEATQVALGDYCLLGDGVTQVKLVGINEIESDIVPTYNFTVEDNKNYFADGILVHNK